MREQQERRLAGGFNERFGTGVSVDTDRIKRWKKGLANPSRPEDPQLNPKPDKDRRTDPAPPAE